MRKIKQIKQKERRTRGTSVGSMKGQEMPESIGMTLIFLLILVGLVMISFLVYIKLNFNIISGEPAVYSVNFVSIASKPFQLAEVLTHMKVVDRQILEHAIETVATGSTESSNSKVLPAGLRLILQLYGFTYYRIGVEVKDATLTEVDNIETRCGEDNKGWCIDSSIGCDVGYVSLDPTDPKGKCAAPGPRPSDTSSIFCCVYKPQEYEQNGNARGKYDVIVCGNGRGVCSEGEKTSFHKATECGKGQVNLGKTDECKNPNSGKTPFCCAERTDELDVETGVTTQAVVPLLYKNTIGTLEVEASGGSP